MVRLEPCEAEVSLKHRNLHREAILSGRLNGVLPPINTGEWTIHLTTCNKTGLNSTDRQRSSLGLIRDGGNDFKYQGLSHSSARPSHVRQGDVPVIPLPESRDAIARNHRRYRQLHRVEDQRFGHRG